MIEESEFITWGNEEPDMIIMPVATYWQIALHFNPKLKLPRKMKKRYLGTRSRRKKAERQWREPKSITMNIETTMEDL